MKKLLGILVLGLMLSFNASLANDVYLACQGTQNSNIILNDNQKKLIVNGETMIITEWTDLKIVFKDSKGIVEVLDRVQGTYNSAFDKQYCIVRKLEQKF